MLLVFNDQRMICDFRAVLGSVPDPCLAHCAATPREDGTGMLERARRNVDLLGYSMSFFPENRLRGYQRPLLHLKRLGPAGIFEAYAHQFEAVWTGSRPVKAPNGTY